MSSSSEDDEEKDFDDAIKKASGISSLEDSDMDNAIGPVLTILSSGDSFGAATLDELIDDHVAVVANYPHGSLENTTDLICMNQSFFNEAVKSYGKSLVYSPATCMSALRMNPPLRSDAQIDMLVRLLLTSPLSLFCSQLPKVCLKEIASVVRVKRIKKGTTLFHNLFTTMI